MKKPKMKMDSATIQTFFLHHVEKILFAAVLLLMALLVYQGFGLQGLDANSSPDRLMQEGTNTLNFINAKGRWETMADEREPLNAVPFKALVEQGQTRTDPVHYFLPMPLSKPDFAKLEPRKDPVLLPPTHVVVVPIFGPLAAIAKTGEVDPLYEVPPEDEDESPRAVPKAKRKAKTKGPPGMSGMMYPGMDGSGMDPSYDPSGGGGQRGARGKARGAKAGRSGVSSSQSGAPGGMPSMDYGSAMQGMSGMDDYGPGMGGMGGMGGYGMRSNAQLYPEATEYGYNSNNPMAIARSVRAMVVMAVVPYEKQWEEHEKALAESLDYDPQRDIPHYVQFFIERADVTDIPNETDPAVLNPRFESLKRGVNAALAEAFGMPPSASNPRGVPPLWAGSPPEIVDPLYLDPKLTHPAPPFMQRDLWDVLVHPEVPLASARTRAAAAETTETPAGTDAMPTDDLPGVMINRRGVGGMGMGGMGGMGGGMSGMPGGFGSGMPGGYGADDYSGSSMPGGYGSGMPGGYGSSMPGYGAGAASYARPKYKLIRFTDTTVEHGKRYRYRVKVLLHDPNHPNVADPTRRTQSAAQTFTAPTPASLDPTVQARLKEVDAADAKSGKRTWWVASDWSEMSAATELPPPGRFYAGAVEPPSVARFDSGAVPAGQPEANSLAVVFDEVKVVDVPAETKVYRGSVLNFTQDVKVIHPVTKELMPLEKYPVKTDAVVADIQGGDDIPRLDRDRSADKKIKAPGEVLVFDARGRLHVQNEVEDIEMFRRFLPKPESEQQQQGMMPGSYEDTGMDPSYDPLGGGMYDGGYEGGSQRTRGRSRGRSQ